MKETVAKPRQMMQQAADSLRQQNAILAKQREQVVRKQQDALRDAELAKQGKADLVAQRKAREEAEKRAKAAEEAKRRRAQITSKAKKAAAESEKKARAAASRASQIKLPQQVVSRGRSLFNTKRRSGFRRTGFIPQMVMLTALNDKKRSQTVNNATRSPSKAPTGPIKDQITEDIRQHKPSIRQYSEGYRETMMELQKLNKMAKKELEAAIKERGGFAGQAKLLGPERTKFWVAKGYSLLKQVNEIVSNEAMRWENGSLNAGVAVSTDTRSQSTRKMTKNEFNMHLSKKLNPIVGKAMNEFEEEVRRAQVAKMSQSNSQSNVDLSKRHMKVEEFIEEFRKHHDPELKKFIDKEYPGLQKALLSYLPKGLKFVPITERYEQDRFYSHLGDAGHEGHIKVGDSVPYVTKDIPTKMKAWDTPRVGTPNEWKAYYTDYFTQMANNGTFTYNNGWNNTQPPTNQPPRDYGYLVYMKLYNCLYTNDGQRATSEAVRQAYLQAMSDPAVKAKMTQINKGSLGIKLRALNKTANLLNTGPKTGSTLGLTPNITAHVGKQRALAGIDKLRGHGRPVLSEQQGTKGLAGLFPALRSSMQGALHR